MDFNSLGFNTGIKKKLSHTCTAGDKGGGTAIQRRYVSPKKEGMGLRYMPPEEGKGLSQGGEKHLPLDGLCR